ncbi:MAG: TVP38/TMEM64 family protein [Alphaproteobacteria bacterium]
MSVLKPYLRGLVLIATFVALGYLVKETGLYDLLDERWIDREIRGRGIAGEMLFVGLGALLTAIGFPRQAVSFLGGYAFGFGVGTGLGLLAAGFGCVLAFTAARVLGRKLVRERFGPRVRRLDDFLHDHPFSMALLIRLLPVGSNAVTNLAAGVSGIRAVPFVAGSVIGYLPQTMIFALLGSGIHLDPSLRIGASVVLFVISGMLGVYLFRRYRTNRALDSDVAIAADGSGGNPDGDGR